MPTVPLAEDAEKLLDEILAAYIKDAQLGLAPPRQQLFDTYPELAQHLSDFFADQDHLEQVAAPLRTLVPASTPVQPGTVVDDYELLEEIAHGGMGTVYRARQKSLTRIVAIKILRADPLSPSAELQRFRAEAEAVAHLDHPHIVPIYDVGTYAGRPWFSMKLLEGGSLAGKMTRYQTGFHGAATLLSTVAETVHFAHERGILHRDLKPANILLDGSGVPYVSDFGLAKRLTAPRSSSSISVAQTLSLQTLSGTILGTPSYMAPEQASGIPGAVTTAVDVYGLGAILYEMLTGQPPFRGTNLFETLRTVQEQDPVPPRTINPRVPRDLETICLKCLQKGPAQRYRSALALAQDLQRFRHGEPIEARPARRLERVGRWCRRHPAVAALSASLLGVLLTALVLVTWQWRRAEQAVAERDIHLAAATMERSRAENALEENQLHLAEVRTERSRAEKALQENKQHLATVRTERDRAQKSRERAEEILDTFCLRMSEKTLNDVPGLQPLRRQLLEMGRRYYQDLLEEYPDSERLRDRLAKANYLIGDLTNDLGLRTDSLKAYRQALELYQRLHQLHADSGEYAYRVALCHQRIAILHTVFDHPQEAFLAYEEARKILEPLHEKQPHNASVQMELANLHNNLAVLCSTRGWRPQAETHYKKNIELLEDLRAQTGNPGAIRGLGVTLTNLGGLLAGQGRRDEARTCFDRARDLLEDLHTRFPRDLETTLCLARSHYRIAAGYCAAQQWEPAFTSLDNSRKLLEPLVAANPDVRVFRETLAEVFQQTGHAQRDTNRLPEALQCYDRALTLLEPLARRDRAAAGPRRARAALSFDKGCVLLRLGRLAEAQDHFTQARDLYRPLAQADPDKIEYATSLGMTLNNLALVIGQRHKPEALEAAQQAWVHNQAVVARHPQVGQARDLLSTSYRILIGGQRHAGDLRAAIQTCLRWRGVRPNNPEHLYQVARQMALIATPPDSEPLSEEDRQQREAWAQQTVEVLGEAVRCGFKDRKKLLADPVFKGLRQRSDFRKALPVEEGTIEKAA
jgi:tetratricopeptide (TPR) repeat protein/tRNA A-37 threonylcarbamoyl transferase component Bud32